LVVFPALVNPRLAIAQLPRIEMSSTCGVVAFPLRSGRSARRSWSIRRFVVIELRQRLSGRVHLASSYPPPPESNYGAAPFLSIDGGFVRDTGK